MIRRCSSFTPRRRPSLLIGVEDGEVSETVRLSFFVRDGMPGLPPSVGLDLDPDEALEMAHLLELHAARVTEVLK